MNNIIDYNLGNDPSLLILDDDEPFTRTLGRAMERRGFEVKTLLSVKSDKEKLEEIINNLIKKNNTNFKGVGQPLRIALVGSRFGPGIYNIILSLSKNEVIKRISKIN